MGMGIEPAEDGCPAGRAQGSGAEMIAEQRTLLCQPVDPWSLSGAVPHTAKSIPPLVIGKNEDHIGPLRLKQS